MAQVDGVRAIKDENTVCGQTRVFHFLWQATDFLTAARQRKGPIKGPFLLQSNSQSDICWYNFESPIGTEAPAYAAGPKGLSAPNELKAQRNVHSFLTSSRSRAGNASRNVSDIFHAGIGGTYSARGACRVLN